MRRAEFTGYPFLFVIFLVGASGIVSQVLLLRELLVSFCGNELTLGIILANWIIAEAAGVFSLGKLINRLKDKIGAFALLEAMFCLALPLSVYLCRTFKNMLGIPFAEAVGLAVIFWASLFIIFPAAFCHGALFSCSCKIYSRPRTDYSACLGLVYSWETAGTIAGGILLSYLLIPYFNSFQTVFIIALLNLVACLFFFKYISARIIKFAVFLTCIFILLFGINLSAVHSYSITRQWQGARVLDYRNSAYGNVAVVARQNQRTFFYNGLPVITVPYPDMTFVEEFANLPLLFSRQPQDILVISSAAGGLINEFLKHSLRKIDYAELDPLIITMLKKYPSGLTERELSDKRVNIINLDGRLFIKSGAAKYDVILVGISRPADLATNRLFTSEFFSLTARRLNPEGILAFWLPGSLAFISQELKDLNGCILNALGSSYPYVRVIPGDYNIILASGSRSILDTGPEEITARINQRRLPNNILIPAYLRYRLDKEKAAWFNQNLSFATKKINRDFMPFAVFQMLILWNKQFSHRAANFLLAAQRLDLKVIFIFIFLLTLVFLYVFYRNPERQILISTGYAIFTSGFFGTLVNLILIFSFQVIYGYLYHKIGILISVFMAGLACGSIFITPRLSRLRHDLGLLMVLDILILVFSASAAFIIPLMDKTTGYPYPVFLALFFIPGLLLGAEFPLAGKIYLKQKIDIGRASGSLYALDLAGGWLAGILGGIIFLPILGLFNSCMAMVMFKLSSLLLLLIAGLKFPLTKKAI